MREIEGDVSNLFLHMKVVQCRSLLLTREIFYFAVAYKCSCFFFGPAFGRVPGVLKSVFKNLLFLRAISEQAISILIIDLLNVLETSGLQIVHFGKKHIYFTEVHNIPPP